MIAQYLLGGGAVATPILILASYCYVRFTRGVCRSKVDLSGKTAIVTGANTGIGYYTALDLAARNGRVILAGRNVEKTESAAAKIRLETGNENVVAMKLDVSLMSDVRRFVQEFKMNESRLDILVNNAGVAGLGYQLTSEGLETVMATNHLGHFLLTNLLLEMLQESSPSRVVNVSSVLHSSGKIEFEFFSKGGSHRRQRAAYHNSKLANVLFTTELSKRCSETGVTAYALHPGAVKTEIWRNIKVPFRWLVKCFFLWFKNSQEGAQTSIFCAVEEGLEEHSGKYFADCALAKQSEASKDDGLAKKLWEASEILTGLS